MLLEYSVIPPLPSHTAPACASAFSVSPEAIRGVLFPMLMKQVHHLQVLLVVYVDDAEVPHDEHVRNPVLPAI